MRMATISVLIIAAACANPERSRLERGMDYAKRRLLEANRNPLAAASLGSIAEMGGNLSSYLYAAMPENADLPRFEDDHPSGRWSISLRALGGDTVIIEGFGESLARPIRAETIVVRPAVPH